MNERIGYDGSSEEVPFKDVDLSTLPKPDPYEGSFYRTEIRMTLEGPEEVRVRVIPPFPTAEERTVAIVKSADLFVRSLQTKGEK